MWKKARMLGAAAGQTGRRADWSCEHGTAHERILAGAEDRDGSNEAALRTTRFRVVAGAVADVLLAEHRSYLPALRPVLDRVHAMAHITGGGLLGNLDRALPKDLDAVIDTSSWEVPDVFRVLQQAGAVEPAEMYRTFNMGVGMVVICAPSDVESVLSAAAAAGVAGWELGSLKPGSGAVILS